MYTLTQVKDLVINQGYAIKNDDSVEKLNEFFSYIREDKFKFFGSLKYYSLNWCDDECLGNSINLSEIELPKKITIEMVIELRKQHPNNLDFGDAFDILVDGMK